MKSIKKLLIKRLLCENQEFDMAILVTGGAGYIGSHTCIELIQQGHDIVIIDNLSNSSIQAIKKIEIITKSSLFFIDGDVEEANLEKARSWFQKAERNGSMEAAAFLAKIKELGVSAE